MAKRLALIHIDLTTMFMQDAEIQNAWWINHWELVKTEIDNYKFKK